VTELERALVAVGREVDVPETPDVVSTVLARIGPRRRFSALPAGRRVAFAVALVLLAAVAATLAVPPARSALLRILQIGGERIEIVESLPEVPVQPDLELILGQRVTLEEARELTGLDLREPDEAPDRVYVGDRGTVWFLYGTPEEPRLLVAQTSQLYVDEGIAMKKLAEAGTTIEPVDVDGNPGLFLSGDPHLLLLFDELGDPVWETARLARDVLVWVDDGVTYRLEGELTRDEALELAGSLR
jgi:hypothetical protein